jgi:hypothetical protein
MEGFRIASGGISKEKKKEDDANPEGIRNKIALRKTAFSAKF